MNRYRAALLVLAGVLCVAVLATTVFAADNFTGTLEAESGEIGVQLGTGTQKPDQQG